MSLHVPAQAGGSPGPDGSAATAAPLPEPAAVPPAPRGGGRERGRLRALDGLRLVAALMVCMYHYAGRDGDIAHSWGRSPKEIFPHLAGAFSYGPLGVQIFFIISGFVICMSGWGRSLKDFAISRVTRLYPAYWAALLLVTVVFAVAGYQRVSNTDLITNVSMLQMPAGAQRVLGVDWTLWAEMRFYLLFAVCVLWRGATRQRVLMFCALWTAGALYAGTSEQPFLETALMPDYAPFFVGGIGLYLVHRFGHDALSWGVVAVGFLLGQRYAVGDLVAPAHTHVFHHRSQAGVIAVVAFGFAAVAAVTLVPRIAGVNWRWLTTAGALTYPFYLVHEHLGWVEIDKLHHRTSLSDPAVFAVTVATMLALAYALHRLVERPVAPRLKRLLSARPVPVR
ncbi:acyltransferase [Streptomyces sp. HPF1205]|uniref:acyltransferase family protein n=1 Tax=Streptomyces sp. HPF1205 TaxID=2873262 RepID=UPI001CED6C4A|nr:acyltransferase [Streptomyces sp. HPF1205]